MSDEITGAPSVDRLLGDELARAASALLTEAGSGRPDPADMVRVATVQALLALYWELRHHRRAADAEPSLAWISALLCAGLPAYEDLPGRG